MWGAADSPCVSPARLTPPLGQAGLNSRRPAAKRRAGFAAFARGRLEKHARSEIYPAHPQPPFEWIALDPAHSDRPGENDTRVKGLPNHVGG